MPPLGGSFHISSFPGFYGSGRSSQCGIAGVVGLHPKLSQSVQLRYMWLENYIITQ